MRLLQLGRDAGDVTARIKQYGAIRAVGMDEKQLTRYFGTPWSLPVELLAVMIVFSIVAVVAAVHAPAKRIRNMEITATINEL